MTSKDCPVGLLCNKEIGLCVQCVTDEDCAENEACTIGNLCFPVIACTSDHDCQAFGLVCDKEAGTCVECTTSNDCAEEETCVETMCLGKVCVPGEVTCIEGAVMTCTDTGTEWELAEQCGSSQICLETECLEQVCVPNKPYCDNSVAHTCDDIGLGPVDAGTNCSQLEQYCVNGECSSCEPNCEDKECGEDGCGGSCGSCEDNDPCTDDGCLDGVCAHSSSADCCNEHEDCEDQNDCTNDTCDQTGACQHGPVDDGVLCSDSDTCTLVDSCSDGVCVGTEQLDCNDDLKCTSDLCHAELGCYHQWISPCCGNGDVDGDEECDDWNTDNDDGCDENCVKEPLSTFLGFANWYQHAKSQSDAAQDEAMDTACSTFFGDLARAARHEDLLNGLIVGLPETNTSGYHILFKCPLCDGSPNPLAVSGHNRLCVPADAPWPTVLEGFEVGCTLGDRTCVCVEDFWP